MNIDQIIEIIVVPILRFPIVLVAFTKFARWFDVLVFVYTVLVNALWWLNRRYKTRGRWQHLDLMGHATCVVTGGSKGLGSAVVNELLTRFANVQVIVVDIAPPKIINSRLTYYPCDLSNESSVNRTLDYIKKNHSKIDVLINNAGIRSKFQNYSDLHKDDVNRVFQVNVFTPMRFIQELSPRDDNNQQFYTVNVASTLGTCAPARASCYGASKAATIAFHEAWTQEIGPYNNFRTLLVMPGQLDTSMFSGFSPPKQFLAPLVDPKALAQRIVECCRTGQRGELCAPMYANFMGLVRVLPYAINQAARKFSGMDSCLPVEKTH
ncbi:LADA_0H14136g1_1 [Lachancea dasiensis]|uniref:LADA_0H14136g1_1 n=1 Tax=Lachancea dasiensis TaxID=1072105 RepID=A0A1G4K4M7_9SACH|nr:LADA_0H14136g1_1 [Lachancea dasiensis]